MLVSKVNRIRADSDYMLDYGLPTNPSIEILSEITKIYYFFSLLVNYVWITFWFSSSLSPHIIKTQIVNLSYLTQYLN